VGCSIEVQEPRLRYLGPCNTDATTTETFTIKNNCSADWTGYNANEYNDDDDWMGTLVYTSAPVVRFATAQVTATINWGAVPETFGGDDQNSYIRFGGSCDGGSTFVYDTPSIDANNQTVNVMDTTPAPVKIIYNGDVSPSTNNSAGTGYRFELWDSSTDMGTIVSDPGVLGASDGLAYFLNDTTSSKTKWQTILNAGGEAMNIDSKVGATALARVKVTATSGTATFTPATGSTHVLFPASCF
jgi:hypothetical protein